MSGRKRPRKSGPVDPEPNAAAEKTDANYSDGDLTIFSSDGVAFKVHSFYIKSLSTVLKDMVDACTDESTELRLTDDTLEHSVVLKLLLDLACSKPLPDFDSLPCQTVLSLIRLAQKYDCGTPQRMISLYMSQPLGPKSNNFNRFMFATVLDDVDAAHRFLPSAAMQTFPGRVTYSATPVTLPVAGSSCMDVTSMSVEWQDQLPRKYFHALLRASRLRLQLPPAQWVTVADEFRILVRLQDPKRKPI